MNTLFISTSDLHGGAAIAAFRLMNALQTKGMNVKMLVRDKRSSNRNVIEVGNKNKNKWNFLWERGKILLANRFYQKNLFDISIANTGVSVTTLPEFQHADIIHLHWINQGMLSLRAENIFTSGKSGMDHARHVALPVSATMQAIMQIINRHAVCVPILLTPHLMTFQTKFSNRNKLLIRRGISPL